MSYQRKEQIGNCTLYLGDCRDILPTLEALDKARRTILDGDK